VHAEAGVDALERGTVVRIVLTRPAVEAGEVDEARYAFYRSLAVHADTLPL